MRGNHPLALQKGVIRRAETETEPVLRAYMQERNNWNDTVVILFSVLDD
jgi:hypothetical protein